MNPLKRELILYLILLAAFSVPLCVTSVLTQIPSLHPSLSLYSFSLLSSFSTLFSEVSVSKSSCRAAEEEAEKDESFRDDSLRVCWCKCWLSEDGKRLPPFTLCFFLQKLSQLWFDFLGCQKSSLLVLLPNEWQ